MMFNLIAPDGTCNPFSFYGTKSNIVVALLPDEIDGEAPKSTSMVYDVQDVAAFRVDVKRATRQAVNVAKSLGLRGKAAAKFILEQSHEYIDTRPAKRRTAPRCIVLGPPTDPELNDIVFGDMGWCLQRGSTQMSGLGRWYPSLVGTLRIVDSAGSGYELTIDPQQDVWLATADSFLPALDPEGEIYNAFTSIDKEVAVA